MDIAFLTPAAGAVVFAVAAPIAAFVWLQRRERQVRETLSLPRPRARVRAAAVAAAAATVATVALAAMQPVIDRTVSAPQRQDAQAYFVFDTSRSMLASESPDGATRLERAKRAAMRVHAELRDVPAGVASLTDRVLPHAFPTADPRVFATTVERAVAIDNPPPVEFYADRATALAALAPVATNDFYGRGARKRLLVVLTDGESRPAGPRFAAALRGPPRVDPIFVHVWSGGEHIYEGGIRERQYRSDPGSRDLLDGIARLTGGRAVDEDEVARAVAAARDFLGQGEVEHVERGRTIPLMPYVTALALLPLGLVLRWRNL